MRTSDVSELIGSLQADELNQLDNQVREVIRGVMRTGQAGAVTTAKITVKLRGVERMQREAMAQMVERVKEATKLPAFAGSPES